MHDLSLDALPIEGPGPMDSPPGPLKPARTYESGSAKRKQSAFRQISAVGLGADVVLGIKHRVAALDKSPDKAKKHFRRSLITAALILGGDCGRGTIFRLDPTSTLYPPSRVANGWQLFFAGLPENTYRVQRSSSAGGPWSTVANAKAGHGAGSWIDAALNLERAFYRLVYP